MYACIKGKQNILRHNKVKHTNIWKQVMCKKQTPKKMKKKDDEVLECFVLGLWNLGRKVIWAYSLNHNLCLYYVCTGQVSNCPSQLPKFSGMQGYIWHSFCYLFSGFAKVLSSPHLQHFHFLAKWFTLLLYGFFLPYHFLFVRCNFFLCWYHLAYKNHLLIIISNFEINVMMKNEKKTGRLWRWLGK